MYFNILITCCCITLSTFTAVAQKKSLSLPQAIDIGIQRNYRVQSARNDSTIAAISNTWGAAGKYPEINANANLNNGFNSNRNPASFLLELTALNAGLTPGIDANWLLYGGNRVQLTKNQLDLQEKQAGGNLRLSVENTITDIILSYYQAVIQQEQLKVRAEVLQLSRERLEYQLTRKEFGQASSFDVIQTQDAYLTDSTAYLVQETNLANALRNLYRAIGDDAPGDGYILTDELPLTVSTYELDALRNNMLNANQELFNLRIGQELAGVQTRFLETFRKPSISLRAGTAYTLSQNIFANGVFANGDERDLGGIRNTSLNFFFNVSASYNLFDGGVRNLNVQNARIREINTNLAINDTRRSLLTQLENTLETFNNQKRVVELSNNLVDNARKNISIAEERFRGGLISFFDYRAIQTSYINATQTRLNAIFNLTTTETELLRLTGGLIR